MTGKVWTAASLGFAGIALVLHASNHELNFGALFGISAAILLAFALMAVRSLSTTEPTLRILSYYFLFATLMVLPFAFYGWHALAPLSWDYLVGVGICLLLSQIFIVIAYRYASAVKLGPIIYSVILFTAVINWIAWGRTPTTFEFVGMALVLAGGLIAVVKKGDNGATDPSA